MSEGAAAPLVREFSQASEAVAANADASVVVCEAPFAAELSAASYTPEANMTGNNDESRAFSIVNKGADGNGTTVMATMDMATGVNATDFNEMALTLSAVEGATEFAA